MSPIETAIVVAIGYGWMHFVGAPIIMDWMADRERERKEAAAKKAGKN